MRKNNEIVLLLAVSWCSVTRFKFVLCFGFMYQIICIIISVQSQLMKSCNKLTIHEFSSRMPHSKEVLSAVSGLDSGSFMCGVWMFSSGGLFSHRSKTPMLRCLQDFFAKEISSCVPSDGNSFQLEQETFFFFWGWLYPNRQQICFLLVIHSAAVQLLSFYIKTADECELWLNTFP